MSTGVYDIKIDPLHPGKDTEDPVLETGAQFTQIVQIKQALHPLPGIMKLAQYFLFIFRFVVGHDGAVRREFLFEVEKLFLNPLDFLFGVPVGSVGPEKRRTVPVSTLIRCSATSPADQVFEEGRVLNCSSGKSTSSDRSSPVDSFRSRSILDFVRMVILRSGDLIEHR